jgi:hypothetical protein
VAQREYRNACLGRPLACLARKGGRVDLFIATETGAASGVSGTSLRIPMNPAGHSDESGHPGPEGRVAADARARLPLDDYLLFDGPRIVRHGVIGELLWDVATSNQAYEAAWVGAAWNGMIEVGRGLRRVGGASGLLGNVAATRGDLAMRKASRRKVSETDGGMRPVDSAQQLTRHQRQRPATAPKPRRGFAEVESLDHLSCSSRHPSM